MPDSEKPTLPAPSARGSFIRKAKRWLLGILAAGALLAAGTLWIYNRAFTNDAPILRASRFTGGNAIFPVQAAVLSDRFSRYKPRFFGHTEDSIPINQIASVKIQAGVAFADLVVDTTGGSPPVVVHGLWKGDAEVLKNRITEARNAQRPAPVSAPPASK